MGSSLVIRASQLPTMRSLLILSLAGIVASKVIFPVPEPYNWDDSVEVFYARIDDEHKVLFDHIKELGHTPKSKMHLSNLKSKMRAHFDYERGLFCNAETYYDCEEHSLKHETFFKRLNAFENPVPAADTDWAKNWLVQHIINTDFDYK